MNEQDPLDQETLDKGTVDRMEAVWLSITDLCETFDETQWKTPTDCPGWSVQDQLSHLVGSETRLLGYPVPAYAPQDVSYVHNETGRTNEILVDWRRSRLGAQVLEEFQEATSQRLGLLRKMNAAGFAEQTQTPIGLATVRELLAIRIFDAWVHEQDIRRAVGRPGAIDGPVARHAMDRMAMAMPYVVGRKVQPGDGTTLVVNVNGLAGRVLAIGMEGTRASFIPAMPVPPTASLSMDLETFACLACGRWDPAAVLDSGRVHIQGDRALGEAFVGQLNFMI